MKIVRRYLIIVCLLVVAVVLTTSVFIKYQIGCQVEDISPAVKPAVEAVLEEQQWSMITGGYWENEMERQAQSISKLPLMERLEFYRNILLYCDLDTSRAVLFVEIVGSDVGALRDDLVRYKGGGVVQDISNVQLKRLNDWIVELEIVDGQDSKN